MPAGDELFEGDAVVLADLGVEDVELGLDAFFVVVDGGRDVSLLAHRRPVRRARGRQAAVVAVAAEDIAGSDAAAVEVVGVLRGVAPRSRCNAAGAVDAVAAVGAGGGEQEGPGGEEGGQAENLGGIHLCRNELLI